MEDKTKLALETFATICQALEENDWKYKKNEEDLVIECGAQGDDLPMELAIKVDARRQFVMLFSRLPFAIQEDKRLDVAVGVSAVNNELADGCFDYDVTTGRMYFRMTNTFMESKMDKEVFTYMLFCSCQTIDQYNDKFLMLSKGMLSMEQFLQAI